MTTAANNLQLVSCPAGYRHPSQKSDLAEGIRNGGVVTVSDLFKSFSQHIGRVVEPEQFAAVLNAMVLEDGLYAGIDDAGEPYVTFESEDDADTSKAIGVGRFLDSDGSENGRITWTYGADGNAVPMGAAVDCVQLMGRVENPIDRLMRELLGGGRPMVSAQDDDEVDDAFTDELRALGADDDEESYS